MRLLKLFLSLVLFISLTLIIPVITPPAALHGAGEDVKDWNRFVNQDGTLSVAVSDSHLWQGTSGGLLVRNFSHPNVYRFYHNQNSPLVSNQVHSIALDGRGGAWLATENGAAYYSASGEWLFYNKNNSPFTVDTVRAVAVDEDGGVWFGTWGGGAYYLDSDNQWTTYNMSSSGIPGDRIYAISPDAKGGVWFGTDSQGAAYLSSLDDWKVYNTQNSELPVNDILDIKGLADGRICFATYKGLAILHESGSWQVYNASNSPLSSDMIYSLASAVSGESETLWIGTAEGLACISASGEWSAYTAADSGLSGDKVKSVAVDDRGRVWAGLWDGGLTVFDPSVSTWDVYKEDHVMRQSRYRLFSNTVNHVLPYPTADDSRIWFSTDKGALALDTGTGRWERHSTAGDRLPGNQVHCTAYHETGGLLFATNDGLALNREGDVTIYRENNSRLPSDAVVDALFDAEGNIWLAFMDAGAAQLTLDGSWILYNTENSPLPCDNINCLAQDASGNIWFGTRKSGAAVLDREGNWQVYNKSNSGLPVNDIEALLVGSQGDMWFGAWEGGLARLDAAGQWTVFHTDNSPLLSNAIRSLALDSRGWLWAATPAGAAYYDGSEMRVVQAHDSGLTANDLSRVATDKLGNVWFSTFGYGVSVFNPDGLPAELQNMDVTERPDILLYYDRYIVADVPARLEEGRVLVPMRAIFSALGARLSWDGELKKVEAVLEDRKIELTIDQATAYINGEPIELEVPARLHDGRTLIPLRFTAESLGLTVDWDGMLRAVILH